MPEVFEVSPAALPYMQLIHAGLRLRIPLRPDKPPHLFQVLYRKKVVGIATIPVPGMESLPDDFTLPVPVDVAAELITSPYLAALNEFRNGNRAGWRDFSIDGEKATIYFPAQ